MRVDNDGQVLCQIDKHRGQPDDRNAVVMALHDMRGRSIKHWGSIFFEIIKKGRSALDVADAVG